MKWGSITGKDIIEWVIKLLTDFIVPISLFILSKKITKNSNMKSNSENQNTHEFCPNARLQAQGFSPCPWVGVIASPLKVIPFEDGKGFLYQLSVEDEDYWNTPYYFF